MALTTTPAPVEITTETFANGFGTWFARFTFDGVPTDKQRDEMPRMAAEAIADEINARQGAQITADDVEVTIDGVGPGAILYREQWDTLG